MTPSCRRPRLCPQNATGDFDEASFFDAVRNMAEQDDAL